MIASGHLAGLLDFEMLAMDDLSLVDSSAGKQKTHSLTEWGITSSDKNSMQPYVVLDKTARISSALLSFVISLHSFLFNQRSYDIRKLIILKIFENNRFISCDHTHLNFSTFSYFQEISDILCIYTKSYHLSIDHCRKICFSLS